MKQNIKYALGGMSALAAVMAMYYLGVGVMAATVYNTSDKVYVEQNKCFALLQSSDTDTITTYLNAHPLSSYPELDVCISLLESHRKEIQASR